MEGKDHGWRLTALAVAWLAGVALQLQEHALMAWSTYALALCVGVVCLLAMWRTRRAFVWAVLGLGLLGFSATGGRAFIQLSDSLPAALEGRDVQVIGVVASLPQRSSAGLRFAFDIEQAQLGGQAV